MRLDFDTPIFSCLKHRPMRQATISQVHDSVPYRLDGGLCAISNTEFLEERLGMGLHAFLADLECLRDFLVAATRDNQTQDF